MYGEPNLCFFMFENLQAAVPRRAAPPPRRHAGAADAPLPRLLRLLMKKNASSACAPPAATARAMRASDCFIYSSSSFRYA